LSKLEVPFEISTASATKRLKATSKLVAPVSLTLSSGEMLDVVAMPIFVVGGHVALGPRLLAQHRV
jgi:hypothetical protein